MQVDDAYLATMYDNDGPAQRHDASYRAWAELRDRGARRARWTASRPSARATTSAGEAGTRPHSTATSRCGTSSTSSCGCRSAATRIEQANPRHEHEWRVCGATSSCPRTACCCPASSATSPTSSSTPSSSPSGSCASPARRAGERRREHGLRLRPGPVRAARPPEHPVGEARGAVRGRPARDGAAQARSLITSAAAGRRRRPARSDRRGRAAHRSPPSPRSCGRCGRSPRASRRRASPSMQAS